MQYPITRLTKIETAFKRITRYNQLRMWPATFLIILLYSLEILKLQSNVVGTNKMPSIFHHFGGIYFSWKLEFLCNLS